MSATTDRQSLTLPDWRTALKRRVKRPRRPNRRMLLSAAALGGWSIVEIVTGSWLPGFLLLLDAACLFFMAFLPINGPRFAYWWRVYKWALAAQFIAAAVWLIAVL